LFRGADTDKHGGLVKMRKGEFIIQCNPMPDNAIE
jgi:hypothetical protein